MPPRANTSTGVGKAVTLRAVQSTRALSKIESANVRRRLERLLEKHKTQTALARALDISQQVLSRILGGDPAGLYVAKRLAALAGLSVDQVLATPLFAVDEAVATAPKRWSAAAIATVRAMPRVESIASAEDAARVLDMVEEALAPIRRELSRLAK